MRIPSPTIRQRADFSSINEMPDLPATGMPRGLTRAGRRTPSGNLARMACGDLPGPGTIARHGCGVAVAAPIGVLRGAFKIAMIPLKTVLGAVVGCIGGAGGGVALAANYSDSATPRMSAGYRRGHSRLYWRHSSGDSRGLGWGIIRRTSGRIRGRILGS